MASRTANPTLDRRKAFTLVEVLIVVVIIGILAAVVVPQFSNAGEASRTNSMRMTLYRTRTQIEIYKNEHDGLYPLLASFEDQMTLSSDRTGATAPVGTPGHPHGPYIEQLPVNPFTNTSDIGAGAVGSSAWFYDETTGTFRANDSAANMTY